MVGLFHCSWHLYAYAIHLCIVHDAHFVAQHFEVVVGFVGGGAACFVFIFR